jgi:hypothetical protein
MPDSAHETHPDELQSDLDLLVDMVRDQRRDVEAVRRHLESLKVKLDKFVHERRHHDGADAA